MLRLGSRAGGGGQAAAWVPAVSPGCARKHAPAGGRPSGVAWRAGGRGGGPSGGPSPPPGVAHAGGDGKGKVGCGGGATTRAAARTGSGCHSAGVQLWHRSAGNDSAGRCSRRLQLRSRTGNNSGAGLSSRRLHFRWSCTGNNGTGLQLWRSRTGNGAGRSQSVCGEATVGNPRCRSYSRTTATTEGATTCRRLRSLRCSCFFLRGTSAGAAARAGVGSTWAQAQA